MKIFERKISRGISTLSILIGLMLFTTTSFAGWVPSTSPYNSNVGGFAWCYGNTWYAYTNEITSTTGTVSIQATAVYKNVNGQELPLALNSNTTHAWYAVDSGYIDPNAFGRSYTFSHFRATHSHTAYGTTQSWVIDVPIGC